MLNYYGINTGGNRDEKMTKTEKKSFLDRLNGNYDAHTVHDILGKIRDKFNDKNKDQDEEESDDPLFDSLKKQMEEAVKNQEFEKAAELRDRIKSCQN
jgi:protein-arginine kinase activator protein McsA